VPGCVIASGILRGEEDRIAEAFAPLGLRETTRRTGGEWIALLLERR
jgi:ribosomal protein L11 methylase PrmA